MLGFEKELSRQGTRFRFQVPDKYAFPGRGVLRLTGSRLTDNLSKPNIIDPIQKKAGKRLIKNTSHELDRELQRLK